MNDNQELKDILVEVKTFLTGTVSALNTLLEEQEKSLTQQKNNIEQLLKQAMDLEKHTEAAKQQSSKDELSEAEIQRLQDIINGRY